MTRKINLTRRGITQPVSNFSERFIKSGSKRFFPAAKRWQLHTHSYFNTWCFVSLDVGDHCSLLTHSKNIAVQGFDLALNLTVVLKYFQAVDEAKAQGQLPLCDLVYSECELVYLLSLIIIMRIHFICIALCIWAISKSQTLPVFTISLFCSSCYKWSNRIQDVIINWVIIVSLNLRKDNLLNKSFSFPVEIKKISNKAGQFGNWDSNPDKENELCPWKLQCNIWVIQQIEYDVSTWCCGDPDQYTRATDAKENCAEMNEVRL